jgi:hypothetical protein
MLCSAFSGVVDTKAMRAFTKLLDEIDDSGLKVMMTLNNCVNDYGGMQQYVR